MEFEWDEEKRRKNWAKHGLDFADTATLDWETATFVEDNRRDYGEQRYWAFAPKERQTNGSHVLMAKRRARNDDFGTPDDDIPEMTAADFKRARPVKQVFPGIIEAAKRARGRPRSAAPKQHVSLRLDAKVVA